LAIISTTGLKRRWAVLLTFGQLFVRGPLLIAHSHSWDIFSCWRIAKLQPALFITSSGKDGISGKFETPADDLSIERFIKIPTAHEASFV
jgi:hypothetical protein